MRGDDVAPDSLDILSRFQTFMEELVPALDCRDKNAAVQAHHPGPLHVTPDIIPNHRIFLNDFNSHSALHSGPLFFANNHSYDVPNADVSRKQTPPHIYHVNFDLLLKLRHTSSPLLRLAHGFLEGLSGRNGDIDEG